LSTRIESIRVLAVLFASGMFACGGEGQVVGDWAANHDAGPGNSRDVGTSTSPDTGTSHRPDTGTNDRPDAGAFDTPDTGTIDPPDTGAIDPPDTGTNDRPDAGAPIPPDAGASPVDADAGVDAGSPIVADGGVVTAESVAIRYPSDRTQSPITESVVQSMQAILANGTGQDLHVFMKVGDSITVNSNTLHCFTAEPPGSVTEGVYRNYGGRDFASTVSFFSSTRVPSSYGATTTSSPFEREPQTARVGESSMWLPEEPARVEQEIGELHPQYALIMFGTNDLSFGGTEDVSGDEVKFWLYPQRMMDVGDLFRSRGVVPVLSTIPPRDGTRIPLLVSTYNAIVRGLAEARQIPLVDYHRELMMISDPAHGVSGDGTHPNVYSPNWSLPCDFTAAGLEYGYNTRNKVLMEGLVRLREVFEQDRASLDSAIGEAPLVPAGSGSVSHPYVIDRLPFTDLRDITASANRALSSYSGCPSATSLNGPENVYRLTLSAPTRLRLFVVGRTASDVAFALTASGGTAPASNCRGASGNPGLRSGSCAAGTYSCVVDTRGLSAGDLGEYFLGGVPCEAGDIACDAAIAP